MTLRANSVPLYANSGQCEPTLCHFVPNLANVSQICNTPCQFWPIWANSVPILSNQSNSVPAVPILTSQSQFWPIWTNSVPVLANLSKFCATIFQKTSFLQHATTIYSILANSVPLCPNSDQSEPNQCCSVPILTNLCQLCATMWQFWAIWDNYSQPVTTPGHSVPILTNMCQLCATPCQLWPIRANSVPLGATPCFSF